MKEAAGKEEKQSCAHYDHDGASRKQMELIDVKGKNKNKNASEAASTPNPNLPKQSHRDPTFMF